MAHARRARPRNPHSSLRGRWESGRGTRGRESSPSPEMYSLPYEATHQFPWALDHPSASGTKYVPQITVIPTCYPSLSSSVQTMRPHAALRPLTRPLPCHQHAHRALAVRAFAQQAKRNKKQPQPATSQTPEPEEDPRRRWLLTAQRISNFAVIPCMSIATPLHPSFPYRTAKRLSFTASFSRITARASTYSAR